MSAIGYVTIGAVDGKEVWRFLRRHFLGAWQRTQI